MLDLGGRLLAGDIFNREFRKIGDDWTKRPITLTLAGVQTQTVELVKPKTDDELIGTAKQLLALCEDLGLMLHVPPNPKASFWYPGRANFWVVTGPDFGEVRWLDEQLTWAAE